MFFEGSEKKVEIIFNKQCQPLRVKREFWKQVVAEAQADILSTINGPMCDAYLLSESSLFVYDHAVIMITCGQTSLIHAVMTILDMVSPENVEFLAYERKNELYPDLQSSSFEDDANILKEVLPGKILTFGEEGGNQLKLFHLLRNFNPVLKDVTLELLMHDLDERILGYFQKANNTIENIRDYTGLKGLIPGFQSDDYLFDPCGYSMNAVKKHAYYTIHVTPEANHSFASFETNYHFKNNLNDVIKKVLNVFQPAHFMVVLFEPREKLQSYKLDLGIPASVESVVDLDCGYRFQFYDFQMYTQKPNSCNAYKLGKNVATI